MYESVLTGPLGVLIGTRAPKMGRATTKATKAAENLIACKKSKGGDEYWRILGSGDTSHIYSVCEWDEMTKLSTALCNRMVRLAAGQKTDGDMNMRVKKSPQEFGG